MPCKSEDMGKYVNCVHSCLVEYGNNVLKGFDVSLFPGFESIMSDKELQASDRKFRCLKLGRLAGLVYLMPCLLLYLSL